MRRHDDGNARRAAGEPGETLSDSGAHTALEPTRPWWRRRWTLIAVVTVIAGASALWLLDGHYGARGWCAATSRVRAGLGAAVTDIADADALLVAQVEFAAKEAPALVARADRMIWPRGDLADRVAAALAAVAAAENPGDQRIPLQSFLELDNEFTAKHCIGLGR